MNYALHNKIDDYTLKVGVIDIPRQAQISFFTPKARFNKQW